MAWMRPRFPSWIRSKKESPRFAYRLAILTTKRRLAWINSFFACCILTTAFWYWPSIFLYRSVFSFISEEMDFDFFPFFPFGLFFPFLVGWPESWVFRRLVFASR